MIEKERERERESLFFGITAIEKQAVTHQIQTGKFVGIKDHRRTRISM
jgi:hypothetical protein